jgi:hypothetical protein
MVIHATLPGLRFWQHGQLRGNRVKVPVQLRRAPIESPVTELRAFSKRLLREVDQSIFHDGMWEMCKTSGWPDNDSHTNLVAWCWHLGEERRVVVVNLTSMPAQGYVTLPPNWLPGAEQYVCIDPIKEDQFLWDSSDVLKSRLYVGLDRYDYHLFRIEKE